MGSVPSRSLVMIESTSISGSTFSDCERVDEADSVDGELEDWDIL